jgi:hypothetical protein
MEVASLAEIVTLHALVQTADLAADAKHSVLWCLDQLPSLYAEFLRQYECRFADKIRHLVQAVLKRLDEKAAGKDSGLVREAIAGRLSDLHQRLGLGSFLLKVPTPGKRRTKKSA